MFQRRIERDSEFYPSHDEYHCHTNMKTDLNFIESGQNEEPQFQNQKWWYRGFKIICPSGRTPNRNKYRFGTDPRHNICLKVKSIN